jgi:hypothetical protein
MFAHGALLDDFKSGAVHTCYPTEMTSIMQADAL